MTRKLRPLVALALVVMAVAGCGSADNDATKTSGGSPVKKSAASESKAVRFAECMRQNGIDGFPDPDASGELTIDAIANGSSVDVDSPAWEQALGECKDLQPSGFTGTERSASQQASVLKFAQCVRENGVPDFPDPTEGSPIIDTNRIPSTQRAGGMSALNAATQSCREDLRDVVKVP